MRNEEPLYIRFKLVSTGWSKGQLILPKDKMRMFHKSAFNLIDDLDTFSFYPNCGNIYMKLSDHASKKCVEKIILLDQLLYSSEPFYSLDKPPKFKLITNDKNGPFRLLTIGTDTFSNLLMNIEDFIKKHHVQLLTDIKIVTSEGCYYDLYFEYIRDGKPKRVLVREEY